MPLSTRLSIRRCVCAAFKTFATRQHAKDLRKEKPNLSCFFADSCLRTQGSSISSSKKLVIGRLSSHPSCLLILDSIDFTDLQPDDIKQHLHTLSAVIHVLVATSSLLRILVTTRSSDVCLLPAPVAASTPPDAQPLPSFVAKVIEIGHL